MTTRLATQVAFSRRRADTGPECNLFDHLFDHSFLTTLGRAEFVIAGPDLTVASAQLVTLKVDAGPDGDRSTACIYIYIYIYCVYIY